MVFISVTRLRLRSLRFLPGFVYYANRATTQAKSARGCLSAKTRKTKGLAFWTLTVWKDEAAMREYRGQGAHRAAMPKMLDWCDEGSMAHWTQDSPTTTWTTAVEQLTRIGRLSKVRYPSADQIAGRIVTTTSLKYLALICWPRWSSPPAAIFPAAPKLRLGCAAARETQDDVAVIET